MSIETAAGNGDPAKADVDPDGVFLAKHEIP